MALALIRIVLDVINTDLLDSACVIFEEKMKNFLSLELLHYSL